jgi:flavodoxin I
MKKSAIFYGRTTGTTESICNEVATKLGCDLINVNGGVEAISDYENVIFASSTWGLGELQDDWANMIDSLSSIDFKGKKVSFIGTGDGASFPDTFVDAIGLIYREIEDKGATFVGQTSTDGYSYGASAAEVEGKFLGLVIDINEEAMNEERINSWVEQLKKELE